MSSWFNDFEIKNRTIHVKSTGARLPLNWEIVHEALIWLPFYLVECAKRIVRRTPKTERLNVTFLPAVPRPWYMLAVSAYRADMNIVKDMEMADAIIYFEDQTTVTPPPLPATLQNKALNFRCTDISKSHVSKVFKDIFGYALAVNPETYTGRIAVKSEINGTHDGHEAQGPIRREDGLVYQRLINNTVDEKWAEDLRCPVIDGDIALIYIKHRPLKKRFANTNANVTLHSPDELLSSEERINIKRFAQAMGLDWGGMDVLRDKDDGKIYIVDVNKTDMGPPIILSLKDKGKATTILTTQLINLIKTKSKRVK